MIKSKFSVLLLALTMVFALLLTSCSVRLNGGRDDDDDDRDEDNDWDDDDNDWDDDDDDWNDDDDDWDNDDADNDDNDDNVPKDPSQLTYQDYDVVWVKDFHNGIAPIIVHVNDGKFWYGYSPFGDKNYEGSYLYGYMDIDGNIIVEPKYYKEVPAQLEGAVCVEQLFGSGNQASRVATIYNAKGEKLVSESDEGIIEIGDVSCGLYWVLTSEELLSGTVYTTTYYDTNGKMKFKFDNAIPGNYNNHDGGNFAESGYAIISIDNQGHLIDLQGNLVNLDLSDLPSSVYSSPYSWVDGNPGFMEGTILFTTQNSKSGSGHTVYFDVKTLKLLYPVPNELAVPPKYQTMLENLSAFQGAEVSSYVVSDDDMYISVKLKSKDGVMFWAVTDVNGNVLIQPSKQYSEIGVFSEGVAAAKDKQSGKWGYIDLTGKWVLSPQYSKSAGTFSQGYTIVEYTKLIDMQGKVVKDFGDSEK